MLLLKRGSSGTQVITLQRALNRIGGYNLKDDGSFGPTTEAAVRDFQRKNGLKDDGVVGEVTGGYLYGKVKTSFDGLTNAQFLKAFPGTTQTMAQDWVPALNAAMERYSIDTPMRAATFLANISHECQNFSKLEESLMYSADRLAAVWPKRYAEGGKPNALALSIAKNPVAIANTTYADRMGNGSIESGDGYKYRGRCPIMLTGRDAYVAATTELGVDLVNNPDKALQPAIGALISGHFWFANGINKFSDLDDFDGCCDKVNIGRKTAPVGDAIGYAQRYQALQRLKDLFGI